MKRYSNYLVLFTTVLLLFFNCAKNQPPQKPTIETEVYTGSIGMAMIISIYTTDQNKDEICYQIKWGDGQEDTSDSYPSEDTVWQRHIYQEAGDYSVLAKAVDKRGGESPWSLPLIMEIDADTLNTQTGQWICATASAGWPPGETKAVVFNNMIWVFPASLNNADKNSIWTSSDGITWTCLTDSTPWSRKLIFGVTVFNDKLWVIGGYIDSLHSVNSIWYSTDGFNWVRAVDSTPWGARDDFSTVVFENKFFIWGGRNSVDELNDVWCSPDGMNLICVNDSAEWYPRCFHTAIVFDNKIWVMGSYGWTGRYMTMDDIWCSSDGIIWTNAVKHAAWTARNCHACAVYDNRIWIMGGVIRTPNGEQATNDIWFSRNGKGWTQSCTTSVWVKRFYHTSVVFDNKLWVIGGMDDFPPNPRGFNDVWYLDLEKH